MFTKVSTTLTANGSTEVVLLSKGADVAIFNEGSLGGGTATVEVSPDGVLWISQGSTITVSPKYTAIAGFSKVPPCYVRITLAGATAPNVTFHLCKA